MYTIYLIISLVITTNITIGQNTASIEVNILNIELNNSKIFVGLYDNDISFKQKINAVDSAKINPEKETVKITFTNIPLGNYAIAVFHDVNNNGKLDYRKFNIPLEPIGISNYPPTKSSLPPTFKKAQFRLNGDTLITIPLISEKKNPDKE